jgi:hypothetical protein
MVTNPTVVAMADIPIRIVPLCYRGARAARGSDQ